MSPQLHNEYNDALEKLEIIIYPDIHRKYLKISHNNLISIVKQEVKFFDLLQKANNGESMSANRSLSSNENVIRTNKDEDEL